MKSVLDPRTEAGIRFRVKELQPGAHARWGHTSAIRVLAHLADLLEGPADDPSSAAAPPAEELSTVRWMRLMASPCPDRKLLVVEESPAPDAATWKAAVARWQDACTRFVARGRAPAGGGYPPHAELGPLTAADWGRLAYLHTDHHLRQFGV